MFSLFFHQPFLFFAWALAFLLALSVHEFSHALVGTWLGDPTAKRMGRLTLNPMAHVDIIGLLAVLAIGFGWGKPVQYNPYNLRWPKWGPAAIAAAGPGSNLLFALIAITVLAFVAPTLGINNLLVLFLATSAQLNIALMAFNLIPLPPLDGSKALLAALAHPRYAAARFFIEQKGPFLLLCFILADSIFRLGIFSNLFFFAAKFVTMLAGFPRVL